MSFLTSFHFWTAECTVMGVPNISTNLSGFGCYMDATVSEHNEYGVWVIDRRYKNPEETMQQLVKVSAIFVPSRAISYSPFPHTQIMFEYTKLTRRQRIILRNRTERLGDILDWKYMSVVGLYAIDSIDIVC